MPTFPSYKQFSGRAFLGAFLKRSLEAFGLFWLVTEPVGLFLPTYVPRGWPVYGALVVLALLSGLIISWPRRSASASAPGQDVRVEIKAGDIFHAAGNVIIGTNDVFDTDTDPDKGFISKASVQGQLVQRRFNDSVSEFDKAVEAELVGLTSTVDASKLKGKNKRYPIGTVIELQKDDTRFYLSAYCSMSPTCVAQTDVCTLLNSLEECWNAIRNSGQRHSVSMPVLGTNFGRMGISRFQVIQLIVVSFLGSNRKQPIAPTLTIFVDKQSSGDIDFGALQLWLRGVLWA